MAEKPPALVRLHLLAQRGVSTLGRIEAVFRNETLWAWIAPEKRQAINLNLYAKEHGYLPGGEHHKQGLFDWERRALTTPPFPSSGRILLGACGGGRELEALLELGFQVVAFDPCSQLLDGARAIVASNPSVQAVQASYEDVARASEGEGPLASYFAEGSFDGVLLGWGSLSHVLSAEDRLRLLSAIRTAAPGAPIVTSFLTADTARPGKIERFGPRLGRFFSRVGAPGAAGPGDCFMPATGFTHFFQPEEIKSLASKIGYEVVRGDLSPYPHVVLAPK